MEDTSRNVGETKRICSESSEPLTSYNGGF